MKLIEALDSNKRDNCKSMVRYIMVLKRYCLKHRTNSDSRYCDHKKDCPLHFTGVCNINSSTPGTWITGG